MAKKDYTSYIIGAAAFGAVGIFIYAKKLIEKRKAEAEAEAERKRVEAEQAEAVKKNIKTSVVLTPYQRKVIDLQTFLGVAVDGKAGPQTNMALQKRAPLAYKTYGAIAPTNVDYYKALLSGPKNLIM